MSNSPDFSIQKRAFTKRRAQHAVIEYPAFCLLIIILSDYLRITISICIFYYMVSSASGQDEPNPALWLATRAGELERYCLLGIARFVSAIKSRLSASECTKLFFRKIFSVTVKRLCYLSAGMARERENRRASSHFYITGFPLVLESAKTIFQCLLYAR